MSCPILTGIAVLSFAGGATAHEFFPETFAPFFTLIKNVDLPAPRQEPGFFCRITSKLSSLDLRNLGEYLDSSNLRSAVLNHPYIAAAGATVTVALITLSVIAYKRNQEAA